LLSDNNVKCWGQGTNYQLGNGSPSHMNSPSPSVPINLGTGLTALTIAAGSFHTCVITNTRGLKCWGNNGNGQLGYGNSNTQTSPPDMFVDLGTDFVPDQVVTGLSHTCARSTAGQVKCWGSNEYGVLGLGLTPGGYVMSPGLKSINLGTGVTAKSVASGYYHICVITNSDAVKCWGNNANGQLGYKDNVHRNAPSAANVSGTPYANPAVVQIRLGAYHTCWLLNTSEVQCWGANSNGQLGYCDKSNTRNFPNGIVDLGAGNKTIALFAAYAHTCAILTDGLLECWGANGQGQLGLNHSLDIGDNENEMGGYLQSVNLGSQTVNSSCARQSSGAGCESCPAGTYASQAGNSACTPCPAGTYSDTMGSNDASACVPCPAGTYSGSTGLSSQAMCVPCAAGRYSTSLGATSNATCLPCMGGQYSSSVGSTTCNMCDAGSGPNAPEPTCTPGVLKSTPAAIDIVAAKEGNHVCALYTGGLVKCWGYNAQGQLGYGDLVDRKSPPSSFVNLGQGVTAKEIAVGSTHTCAITNTGTVKCWGFNGYGQLGYGDTTNRNSPPSTAVNLGSGVTAKKISAGYYHTCVITDTDNVKCWGENSNYQLGYGDMTQRNSPPATFLGVSSVMKVSCGGWNTCLLLYDGNTVCWGSNYYGQMGTGSCCTTQASASWPWSGAKYISMGIYHACIIDFSSLIRCWGDNAQYQLGFASPATMYSPGYGYVVNLGHVNVDVAVSSQFTCVLSSTGVVKCWGAWYGGVLGSGATTSTPSPQTVLLGTGVKATRIAAGVSFVCAILTTGGIKCWGSNDYGQLGYDDTMPRSTVSNLGDNMPVVNSGTINNTVACTLPAGATDCLECPIGTYAYAGNKSCVQCPGGTYSDAVGANTSDTCLKCPVGSFSVSGSSQCSPCPKGTFADQEGTAGCTLCPAGTFSDEVSANNSGTCQPCPIGTYTPPGSMQCLQCPPGSYNPLETQGACALCPGGMYSEAIGAVDNSVCLVCPVGTYSVNGSANCTNCPAGRYNSNPGAGNITMCLTCAAGTYSFAGNSSCTSCTPGKYSTATGATSITTCTACSAGRYSNVTGASVSTLCLQCPAGSYSLASSFMCTLCPSGTYSSTVAATSSATCLTCGTGTYSFEGNTSCTLCPAGTASAATKAVNASTCVICPAGTISSSAGSATCTPCGTGSYSFAGNISCTSCPAGTASSATGAVDASTCAICPAGTISSSAGSATCATCGTGTYSFAGNTSCTACPAGTASAVTRATNASTCAVCPVGTYSTVQSATCTACSAGRYSNVTGATSITTCLQCPAGSYSLAGSSQCTLCPAGTASATLAATSSAACVTCAAGTYSFEGNTSCISCPAGTASAATRATNASTCATCLAGTYSALGAASCTQCPAGAFSGLLGATNVLNCTKCVAGTYSATLGAVNISTCLQCPLDTFSELVGAGSLASCASCPGSQFSNLGSTNCSGCPGGTFACKTVLDIKPIKAAAMCEGSSAQHTCMISQEGSLKCWGSNFYGQLGYGDTKQRDSPPATFVDLGTGVLAKQVVCAARHTCVLTTTGIILCWGDNSMGQLGIGTNPAPKYSPLQSGFVFLGTGVTAVHISAGLYHNCIATALRQMKCWGRNMEGQLGAGTLTSYYYIPTDFVNMWSTNDVVQVACGGYHSCAINWGQNVQCWGQNYFGQIGDGTSIFKTYPSSALNLGGFTAKQIVAGHEHACALLSNNQVRCWGANHLGQLGDESASSRNRPVQVANLGPYGSVTVVQITAGSKHTCWLLSTAEIQCWGAGSSGQLGLASTSARYAAMDLLDIGSGLFAINISAYDSSTCAILTDRTMKCWGWNGFGQLGIGNLVNMGDSSIRVGNSLPRLNLGTVDLTVTCAIKSEGPGCNACPSGTFSTQGSSACSNCTAGTYATNSSSSACTTCLPGKFSTAIGASNATVCADCARGTYSQVQGSTRCTNCTLGTYSDLLGSPSNSTCAMCPPGTYTTTAGASTCLTCAAGSFSTVSGATSCDTCPSGTASTL